MEVRVDPDLCEGCGVCEETCPEVFEIVDDLAEVKVDEVPAEYEDTCREAAADCPTDAIIIEE